MRKLMIQYMQKKKAPQDILMFGREFIMLRGVLYMDEVFAV